MATVSLFDPRNPIHAGSAILEDMLNGQNVVADREALTHALYDAAQLVGEKWNKIADTADGCGHGDDVRARDLANARAELLRATEIAEAIFAAIEADAAPTEAVA